LCLAYEKLMCAMDQKLGLNFILFIGDSIRLHRRQRILRTNSFTKETPFYFGPIFSSSLNKTTHVLK